MQNCVPAWGWRYWPFLFCPLNWVPADSEDAQGTVNRKWYLQWPAAPEKCVAESDSSKNLEKLPACSASRALHLRSPQVHLSTEQASLSGGGLTVPCSGKSINTKLKKKKRLQGSDGRRFGGCGHVWVRVFEVCIFSDHGTQLIKTILPLESDQIVAQRAYSKNVSLSILTKALS